MTNTWHTNLRLYSSIISGMLVILLQFSGLITCKHDWNASFKWLNKCSRLSKCQRKVSEYCVCQETVGLENRVYGSVQGVCLCSMLGFCFSWSFWFHFMLLVLSVFSWFWNFPMVLYSLVNNFWRVHLYCFC